MTVDYSRLDTSGFADCIRVQHKKLARAVLRFVGQAQEEEYAISTIVASDLAGYVHSTGFANPCVVRATENAQSTLGIRYSLLHYFTTLRTRSDDEDFARIGLPLYLSMQIIIFL